MSRSPEGPGGATSPGLATDLILGIVIVLFSLLLLFWIIPAQVNDAGAFGLPPSLAPRALAWLMAALGAMLIVGNLRHNGEVDPLAGKLSWQDVGHLALCILSVAFMLIVMRLAGDAIGRPYSGFWIAAPLGLIAFTLIHTRAPLWAYAFNALAAPAVIYAGFWWGLELPLP
ncbi:tripartite tricarboxylate transporter TctB family protein [Alphaproteobacteria bacterium KMM 3653]|uniref:Tripartite tricarboxylate transporter TctB family protein n=1 Tax=Harenicola maris TaxID=2841044 RepID=A0AAP2G9E0_9RHOB|nr:tripartite tricarboxylate transporter TctB family protein [Harenicola maris]